MLVVIYSSGMQDAGGNSLFFGTCPCIDILILLMFNVGSSMCCMFFVCACWFFFPFARVCFHGRLVAVSYVSRLNVWFRVSCLSGF